MIKLDFKRNKCKVKTKHISEFLLDLSLLLDHIKSNCTMSCMNEATKLIEDYLREYKILLEVFNNENHK